MLRTTCFNFEATYPFPSETTIDFALDTITCILGHVHTTPSLKENCSLYVRCSKPLSIAALSKQLHLLIKITPGILKLGKKVNFHMRKSDVYPLFHIVFPIQLHAMHIAGNLNSVLIMMIYLNRKYVCELQQQSKIRPNFIITSLLFSKKRTHNCAVRSIKSNIVAAVRDCIFCEHTQEV